MSSVHQSADTQPLDENDVINTLGDKLHSIGFINEVDELIYPVKVEVQFPDVIMTMSDGSVFKLAVEEVS